MNLYLPTAGVEGYAGQTKEDGVEDWATLVRDLIVPFLLLGLEENLNCNVGLVVEMSASLYSLLLCF